MRLVLALALLISATPSEAKHLVLGAGVRSCGAWTTDRVQNRAALREAWLIGFVSGHNAYATTSRNVGETTDDAAMFSWIDNHCRANPLDTLEEAAIAMVAAITARR